MSAIERLMRALTAGAPVLPADARKLVEDHWFETRAAELGKAADAIGLLPQDDELDPGRGDSARLLRVMAETDEYGESYPPALSWAKQLDADDLEGFLLELSDAASGTEDLTTLAAVENVIGTWRALDEAQRAHQAAPGPGAETGTP